MSKLFSIPLLGIKILVSLILVWFGLAFAVDSSNHVTQVFGSFLFFFIALVTIFIFFFKKRLLQRFPKLTLIWRIVFVLYIICLAYVAVQMVFGFIRIDDKQKTQEALNVINSQKINLADVMGENLPPKPDQTLNDSTIAGIDHNNNYIRDDVELAIFAKYPDSAKIRAAELQYAQALQLELTQVFNSETLIAVIRKESYGQSCIDETDTSFDITDSRVNEIENLVLNVDIRKQKNSDVLNKYMTSYSIAPREQCEVDFSSLPN